MCWCSHTLSSNIFSSTVVWDSFLPSVVSNTPLSTCLSYLPVAMLIDLRLSTACCFKASRVWESLAGGQFNDVDLCVHIALCVYRMPVQHWRMGLDIAFHLIFFHCIPPHTNILLCLSLQSLDPGWWAVPMTLNLTCFTVLNSNYRKKYLTSNALTRFSLYIPIFFILYSSAFLSSYWLRHSC